MFLDHYHFSLQSLQRSQPAKSLLPHSTLFDFGGFFISIHNEGGDFTLGRMRSESEALMESSLTVIYLGMGLIGLSLYTLWDKGIRSKRCYTCGEKLQRGTGKRYCSNCFTSSLSIACEKCGEGKGLKIFCPKCFKIYIASKHSDTFKELVRGVIEQ